MRCSSGIDVCAKKVWYPVINKWIKPLIKKCRAEAEKYPGPTMPETKSSPADAHARQPKLLIVQSYS